MSPAHRVTAHVHCRAARHAREMRERWRAGKIPKEKGTQRYRAWARRNLEKVAAKRERRRVRRREERQAMPPEAHLPRFTALNNTARRTWERTRQTAEHSGTPWSLEEDVYLIEHGPTRMVEVALDLGRTLYAVHCRLFRLRHAAAQEGRALEEMLGQRAQGGDAARGPA